MIRSNSYPIRSTQHQQQQQHKQEQSQLSFLDESFKYRIRSKVPKNSINWKIFINPLISELYQLVQDQRIDRFISRQQSARKGYIISRQLRGNNKFKILQTPNTIQSQKQQSEEGAIIKNFEKVPKATNKQVQTIEPLQSANEGWQQKYEKQLIKLQLEQRKYLLQILHKHYEKEHKTKI